ncbi:MAG: NAD(P)/FAD-dependent oxidoreductase [Kiloniellales bacterium]|nr:NAD(P)/FAD-dependent oxidoreductase [Kiloniellales bacterium]
MLGEDNLADGDFDVAVIGAGVVGAAAARRLALEGARVAILEKALEPLDGASKGNSAILHTGFDAPVGSLEHRCVVEGRRIFLENRDSLGLPLHETGALVLAWTEEQAAKLDELVSQAHQNSVTDAELISRSEILALEPHLSEKVVAGFRVPGEHVIDPWTTPYAYLTQALAHHAELYRACELLGAEWDGELWRLHTSHGRILARAVVNCAGLYGDVVEKRLLGEARLTIMPRKGQFVVFDKAASKLVRSILLPVPTERTKGVVLCRTIFGNVLIGPTAEEQDSRDDASVDGETLRRLRDRAIEMVPTIADCEVTAIYAGIRPATDKKEYRIIAEPERRYVNLGGIRSTGLTGALGLAEHLVLEHGEAIGVGGYARAPVASPSPVSLQHLSDYHERDWSRPGNGGIICHCEKVTRREIEAALTGPIPARSFAGLKRRTRVCMGRCQGFYCLAAVAALTRGKLDEPIVLDDRALCDVA